LQAVAAEIGKWDIGSISVLVGAKAVPYE